MKKDRLMRIILKFMMKLLLHLMCDGPTGAMVI